MFIIMSRRPVIFLLLLIIMNFQQVENKGLGGISILIEILANAGEIMRSSKEIYLWMKKIITDPSRLATDQNPITLFYHWINEDDDDDDSAKFDRIESMMLDLSMQYHWIATRMEAMFKALPGEIEFNSRKLDLVNSVGKVHDIYNETIKYSRDISTLNNGTLRDLAAILTGKSSGNLHDTLLHLKHNIAPTTTRDIHGSFLDIFIQHMQDSKRCGNQLVNRHLYDLYKTIITTELIGQIAESFGYYLQNRLYNVDVTTEMRIAQELRELRLKDYVIQFKNYLGKASTTIRSCDPENLIRGENFIEMEKLYNAVISEDYDNIYEKSCKGGCADIDRRYMRDRFDRFSCRHLHQCRDIEVSQYCWNLPRNPRTYEWIEKRDGKIYGKKTDHCSGRRWKSQGNFHTADFYKCEKCVCTCEGTMNVNSPGVQFLDLRRVESDYVLNKVVTGIRFSRPWKDMMISIEIKQGRLLPDGAIDKRSEEWFRREMNYIRPTGLFIPMGSDIIAISSENNFIDLDDLIVPEGHAVVGVQFDESDESDETHIQLKLSYMKFNFSSGLLVGRLHETFSRDPHSNKANIDGAKSPLQEKTSRYPTTPYTRPNSYIQFGMSDFETDVGQTTLPLFDATNVEIDPSVPLRGIGLFYKNSSGYGGFLAFRIYTLNYGEYMRGLDMIDQLLGGNLDGSVIENTTILTNTSTIANNSPSTE